MFDAIKNLHKTDVYFRRTLAMGIAFLSVHYQSYWLLIPVILLFYTAVAGHCFIYQLLGINHDLMKKNELLSLLPHHNPSPVFIFSAKGERIFANEPATEKLNQIEELQQFSSDESHHIHDTIAKESKHSLLYQSNTQSYLVTLIGVKNKDIVMAYAKDITDVIKANQEIIQTQKEIVYTMGEIGETRSKETGNHVKRVAEYSALLAKKIGLDNEEAELIKMASPMHDIGKVGIPDMVLNKPGKLDEQEWEIMKTHAQLGYEMLKHSDRPILKASAIIAQQHHERYDGKGYPNQLSGEDIHIYARITAVADVFDALGSERVYKKAWELDKILGLFKTEQGQHFDPNLVQILFDSLDEFLVIRDKYQDIG